MSQQQLLNPPKPPTIHEPGCLLLASSGFYIRLHEDGSASLVDGIQDVDLADLILDTIGREPSDRSPVGADSHVSEPLELLTDETGIIAANQR